MNDFRLAGRQDEADLRHLSQLPVPGRWLDLSYQRQPDFFEGLNSPEDQVLIGRDQSHELTSMAVRSPVRLWLNARQRPMGYLGSWRIAPRHQGRALLFEGFELLRQLHQDQRVDEYLATVVEGNQLARQLLVQKPRRQWPRFHPAGQLCTLALETTPRCTAQPADPRQSEQFALHHGPLRAFFPCEITDHPAERRNWVSHQGVVGAIRDFSACRQTVVRGYHGLLRWLRPLYNGWARCWGRPVLPPPGAALRGAYLGYWASDGFRPKAFEEWLGRALGLARKAGLDWLYLGLLRDDPYLATARRFRHRLYTSAFYRVRYQGLPEPWREGAAYLELAWL